MRKTDPRRNEERIRLSLVFVPMTTPATNLTTVSEINGPFFTLTSYTVWTFLIQMREELLWQELSLQRFNCSVKAH